MTLLIDQLGNRRQFVLARLSPKDGGGTDKIPVSPITGGPVDGQDSANHMSGAEAAACAALWGEDYGPGIVIAEGSGLFCIDLDHCREGAGWAPHAHNFIARFPGAYVEVSQSGNGLHIIGSYRGEIPAHRTRNKDYRTECYTRSRFIYLGSQGQGSALTDCTEALQAFLTQFFPAHEKTDPGEWRDTPLPGGTCIEDDAELIRRAMNSTSAQAVFGGGTSFAALWTANAEVLGRTFRPDNSYDAWNRSSADLGLANHLCFWTRGNHERMARLMRSCDALYRPKWDRPDYIPRTVRTACEDQTEWYDGRAEPASAPVAVSVPTVPTGASTASVPIATAGTATVVAEQSAGAVAGLAPAPPAVMATLTVNSKAQAEASLPNLVKILAAQTTGRIGFDTFRDCIMIEQTPGQWRRLKDNDLKRMRETLERAHRFAPVPKEMFRDAIDIVAEDYQFDSFTLWLDQQHWDGVPRVNRFMADICGAVDDDYSRAVSRYIWSGLACRAYEPGCQLDMVVAMYSKIQGLHKSSALREMVPDAEFFTDSLDLHKDDDNFKRRMRGKIVIEIAEMVGVSTAAVEYIKRVITRRDEEWVEKWQTIPTRYLRRCMLFATTNQQQFLPLDETGQRRWLPNEIQRIDRERLKRDRGQLWAEGANIYRVRKQLGLPGVEYENAEALARGKHSKHEQADVWEDAIEKWLQTPIGGPNSEILPAPCTRPFTIFEVLAGALLMNKDRMDQRAQKRVGVVLKALGYDKKEMRVAGEKTRYWQKVPA